MFDAGAVVPAPIEDDDFSGRRKLFNIALHEKLRLLPLGWRRKSDDPEDPRADPFGDRANGAAFACGVASLERNNDPQTLLLNPFLQLA